MAQRNHLVLTPEEVQALQRIVTQDTPSRARRARIILKTGEGIPQITIAAELGLSERQVRRWQRAFEQKRMAIFERPTPAPRKKRAVRRPTKPEPAASRPPTPEPVPQPEDPPPQPALRLDKTPGVCADDPMSEAGRKVLFYHYERMLLNEPGTRAGEDIEALHDLRVATRRMRSAMRVFAPFYRRKAIAGFTRDLRRTGRALGKVRDMDVFLEGITTYQKQQAEPGLLVPLLTACRADRDTARAKMLAYLDSPDYAGFVTGFGAFLTTDGMGAKKQSNSAVQAHQVRHVAPRLVYTRYEAVRAYETELDRATVSTLHALRVEFKRLRYTLEFFREVLGPEIATVINEVKGVQDHLGALNDAEVAGRFLQRFITRYEREQVAAPLAERQSVEQMIQYMAFQFAEKHRLTTAFPTTWATFNREEIRRALALAVAAL